MSSKTNGIVGRGINCGVPRGGKSPLAAFPKGRLLGKNVKIYVKMVKFALQNVTFFGNMDKRAGNLGRHR